MNDVMLKSKTPAARLAEVERELAAARAERAQHVERRPAEVVGRMTGAPGAAARVEAIDTEIAKIDERIRDLAAAAGEFHNRINRDAANARRAEIEQRPKRVAELRGAYIKHVERIQRHAEQMALEIRALAADGDALAAELGGTHPQRMLNPSIRLHRLQAGLARLFVIDPTRALVAENSLLGIASHEVGARSHWTVTHHEQALCDNLAPFFDDEAAAEAAQRRLAARGEPVVIVKLPHDVFALIGREHVFGDRARAEGVASRASAAGKALAVLEHDGGFILLDARFASQGDR